jgi:hypothetical protein
LIGHLSESKKFSASDRILVGARVSVFLSCASSGFYGQAMHRNAGANACKIKRYSSIEEGIPAADIVEAVQLRAINKASTQDQVRLALAGGRQALQTVDTRRIPSLKQIVLSLDLRLRPY